MKIPVRQNVLHLIHVVPDETGLLVRKRTWLCNYQIIGYKKNCQTDKVTSNRANAKYK